MITEMEELASPVATFIIDRCRLAPSASVQVITLYDSWRDWCEVHGRKASTAQTFERNLKAVAPAIETTQRRTGEAGERERWYKGIELN